MYLALVKKLMRSECRMLPPPALPSPFYRCTQTTAFSPGISIPPLGHRLGPVAHPKFQENSVLKLMDHRETQPEFVGDFFVKQSLRKATHHLMLSFGQANVFFAPSC